MIKLNDTELKAHILSYGINVTSAAIEKFSHETVYLAKRRVYGNPDDEEYLGIELPQEILFDNGFAANIVYRKSSPWTLDVDMDGYFLQRSEYFKHYVRFTPRPAFYGKKLKNGDTVESVVTYLFGHTLGFFINTSCAFADAGKPCKFCSILSNSNRPDNMAMGIDSELAAEALRIALSNCDVPLDGIFISGGNYATDFDTNFREYVSFAIEMKRIVKECGHDLAVTINVYPPKDLTIVEKLRGKGIGLMVSCEVFDSARFSLICPGKSAALCKDRLIAILKSYVDVVGKGHVFAFIIHGLESEKTLLTGLKEFARLGICPITHVLRIEPDTQINSCDGIYVPTPEQILSVAKTMKKLCDKYGYDSSHAYGGRSSLDGEYSCSHNFLL